MPYCNGVFKRTILSWAQEHASITPVIQTEANIPGDIFNDSLARLPQVQRSNLDAQGRRAFDTYVSPGTGYETGLRGPVGMWMHSPNLARRFSMFVSVYVTEHQKIKE